MVFNNTNYILCQTVFTIDRKSIGEIGLRESETEEGRERICAYIIV